MVLSVEHVVMNVIVNLNYLNTHYELGEVGFPFNHLYTNQSDSKMNVKNG